MADEDLGARGAQVGLEVGEGVLCLRDEDVGQLGDFAVGGWGAGGAVEGGEGVVVAEGGRADAQVDAVGEAGGDEV